MNPVYQVVFKKQQDYRNNMPIHFHKARGLAQVFAYLFLMLLLSSCAAGPTSKAQSRLPEGAGRLVVEITGLRNDAGEVFLSVYPGRQGFPNDITVAVVNRHQPIIDRQCRVVIDPLPYGEYAVSVLHDENLDGQMASTLLGIPKEGFGFSGNPKAKLGPPDYDDVRFLLLSPEKTMTIVMQYETVGREKQRIMQERKSKGAGE